MKKQILSLFAVVALSTTVKSQITVNSTDVISVGDLVIQAGDTLISITPTAAGTNQTWDFSALAQHTLDTLRAVDPTTTPLGSNYPTANIALEGTDGSTIYGEKSTGAFEFVGATLYGVPAEQYEKLIEFPATYGNSFTAPRTTYAKASGSDVGQPTADSVEYISKGTKTSSFDAWGTLTTPLGTYSVIRQVSEVIYSDTINVKYSGSWIYGLQTNTDTVYEHQFWTNDASVKFPIVTYQLNAQGNYANKSVSYLKTFSFASIDELNYNKLSVYPNPANDIINFNFDGNINGIAITDVTGKLVYNYTRNRNTVNISNLDYGTYVLSVTSENTIYTSKFIKK